MQAYTSRVDGLRVNVDDLQVMATSCQVSAEKLADGGPASPERSFQPSAAAVSAVRAGIGTARAALSARTVVTGVKIAAADARYVEQEAETSARLDAVGSRVP
jgi:hypothetical protein